MTRDTIPPVNDVIGCRDGEISLLAGLWEEAPFARLPVDAPSELRDLVEDIDNPRRVYAVHKASRRHNFQLLVQRYIIQLRDGCGSSECATPTCFTCRRRLAGKGPIRRYNTTSARTLAIYMASEDNPEHALCPTLRQPKGPPAALNSLSFMSTAKPQARNGKATNKDNIPSIAKPRASYNKGRREDAERPVSVPDGQKRATSPAPPAMAVEPPIAHSAERERDEQQGARPPFSVRDGPVTKDYRSFSANMFGTVAFKMLEWLTPVGIEEMIRQTQQFQLADNHDRPKQPSNKARAPDPKSSTPIATSNNVATANELPNLPKLAVQPGPVTKSAQDVTSDAKGATSGRPVTGPVQRTSLQGTGSYEAQVKSRESMQFGQSQPQPMLKTDGAKDTPTVKATKTQVPKTIRKPLSVDTYVQDSVLDEWPSRLSHNEKPLRQVRPVNGSIPRPISQLTGVGHFDDVSLERMPPPRPFETIAKLGRSQMDGGSSSSGSSSPKDPTPKSAVTPEVLPSDRPFEPGTIEMDSSLESFYPQTLSRLNTDVVDFICDVLQEDNTAEPHTLEPQAVDPARLRKLGASKPLRRRKSLSQSENHVNLRTEWRLFSEQTLFYVLSDPQRVVRSFTREGALYDSQTVWYCMVRLTRVAPSIVFHSLWMASEALFAPPEAVQKLRSSSAGTLLPRQSHSLSNAEAGCLLSICLHALVAAAPLVSDEDQLYNISRVRSHGLSLATSGAIAKVPTDLCLQYDDAFSNELAIRLARRLFLAIAARQCFDELSASNLGSSDEPDIFTSLFSHMQIDMVQYTAFILHFSVKDSALHEARLSTLLLDWARAVMLHDWSGSPVVPGDGPIGGALALIKALWEKRHTFVLADSRFRSPYFADRLDTVEMPIGWLSHTSTRQKLHVLDFPFLFNSATLVSYFRSINFSRMSRTYEESSSQETRMEMIVNRCSPSLTEHQKYVLTDMMSTATTKFFVLSVRRGHVLEDAFNQMWRREERELLRPLKVRLGEDEGEEGYDVGGVQQEFFRLAIAEALDPRFGAFTVDERTRMTWFKPGSTEEPWKYELIGLLMSLAVYNGIVLPITFPSAFYRKLLGEPVTDLHHIADGWPDLASGLTTLSEWNEKDGRIEDVFTRTYDFSVESFSNQPITREMTSNPSPWPQFQSTVSPTTCEQPSSSSSPLPLTPPTSADKEAPLVTSANRNAYIYDYIRYLTDVSIRPQFEAFSRGFKTCFHPKSLSLLNSSTLQTLVEGVQEIDIAELRRHTRYHEPYDASHRTIRDFWSIVKKYDDKMKKKLLEFVTASDRLPVGGVKNLQFTIQKNGDQGEGGHLPTAYTCFGILLLPEYETKEILRERLALALENAQGFGFL